MFQKMRIQSIVHKIDFVLDIELKPQEIDFIFCKTSQLPPDLRSGKELCVMLRQILNRKVKWVWKLRGPILFSEAPNYIPVATNLDNNMRVRRYLLRWRWLYNQLASNNIKVARVLWL